MKLVVVDLACGRAGRRVFEGVSFALEPGEALVVTGRNGAGKSTLLGALAGLIRPDRGRVGIEGADDLPLREAVHLIGHRDGLKPALTAAENLAFAAAALGERRLDPPDALAALGLARGADLPAAYLSAGQKRRVLLARLLVAHRPIWLLDEPTTALDDEGQELVIRLAERHREAGGIVVAATHAPLPLAGTREIRIEPAARRPALP